jgi:hypothetical protein
MAGKGGKREGAGRKSKKDENLIMSVVNMSWQRVSDILTKQGHTKEKKDMVALEIAKKTAPKNIKLEGDETCPVLVKIIGKDETNNNGNTK